jgi:hypothetical protein
MFKFLKSLLGIEEEPAAPRKSQREGPAWSEPRSRAAVDRYFALLGKLQTAKKEREWRRAAKVTCDIIDVLPGFVREWKSEYGDVPPNIPVFIDGARALAMVGDDSGLERLREVTQKVPELGEWGPAVEQAIEDRRLLVRIRDVLAQRPGILQTDVKSAVGASDGRRISGLIRQMAESHEIKRIRYKSTYLLGLGNAEIALPDDHPARSSQTSSDSPTRVEVATTFDQSYERRRPIQPALITLDGLEYVPLPRAPLRWEERHKKRGKGPRTTDDFELQDGTPWHLSEVEKLPMGERPDTAYRKLAPHAAGTFLIDDLGKAESFPGAAAALLSVGRFGQVQAEAPLAWGLYRWQVNPMGRGLIAMDSDGVVHAYDENLTRLFATPLGKAPEMSRLMATYDFGAKELKNHTRTVALSPDGGTHLFTVVDQAFTIGPGGSPEWGVQLPKQDGWSRVAQVSGQFGTGAEVDQALDLLELKLPVSVDDIRGRYRQLAKRWHPDANRGSVEAGERFKEISAAAELLSGLDLQSLAPDVDRVVYERSLGGGSGIEAFLQVSEKGASDWIYAASFATDGGVFLAGYSGRVVRTDSSGRPWRAYDIGAVPRRIADTGDFLYLLTDTRLYILQDRSLVRLIDVFDEGMLVLGQTGFGLLEKRRFRWFTEEGDLVGAVLTKSPIRRVHSTPKGLVVETRERRARISGAPMWWE